MEYLIYVIALLIAMRVGWKLHEMWFLYIIREEPEKLEAAIALAKQALAEQDDGQEVLALKVTELEIERVGSMMYAYDKLTGQFLAQGNTIKEVLDAYQKRFPNRKLSSLVPKDVQNS